MVSENTLDRMLMLWAMTAHTLGMADFTVSINPSCVTNFFSCSIST